MKKSRASGLGLRVNNQVRKGISIVQVRVLLEKQDRSTTPDRLKQYRCRMGRRSLRLCRTVSKMLEAYYGLAYIGPPASNSGNAGACRGTVMHLPLPLAVTLTEWGPNSLNPIRVGGATSSSDNPKGSL